MKYSAILIMAIIGLSFTACTPKLTPFTQSMYEENNWSTQELEKIQFYLSDDIILQRDAGGSESRISKGQIKIINGREVEQIVFSAGTPGVIVDFPKQDRFAISFEEGTDNYLLFGKSKNSGGRYVVLAKDWKNRYGKVTYQGKEYTINTNSAYASLMVDIKKARKVSTKTKNIGGRRINS